MHVDPAFPKLSGRALADAKLGDALREVEVVMPVIRREALGQLDFEAARRRAAEIKDEALGRLDYYLGQFEERVTAMGGHVHWARDDAEAVAMANRTRLGLQAAVFTSSLQKAFWYADHIRSGTVVVNDSTDFWETFQPFGGAAGTDTGWGRGTIDDFTDLQTVVFDLKNVQ